MAGELARKQGTLINIHVQQEKEKPSTEKYPVFTPENS